MVITIMNLLVLIAVVLTVVLSGFGLYEIISNQRSWKEVDSKAVHSPIKGIDF